LFQDLTLVSFPAISTVLRQVHGVTDAQYGLIFLPQVAMAVLGSITGGTLARRLGLKTLLLLSLAANAGSQAALGASNTMGGLAFASVFVGATLLGLGLGFGLAGVPLNSYPPSSSPQQRDSALVALHTALALGLAGGPLVAVRFIEAGAWVGFPLLLLATCLVLALAVVVVPFPPTDVPVGMPARQSGPRPLGSIVFRGALAGGRLLVSALTLRIPAERIWRALPVLMVTAFLLLPHADGPVLRRGTAPPGGPRLLRVFPPHHRPSLHPLPRPRRLGVVHDDRSPHGGRGARDVRHRAPARRPSAH
jgi:MFS family permease